MGGFLLNKAEALAKKADEALKQRDEVNAAKYLQVAGREYLKREEYWKAQEAFVKLISIWAEAKLIGRILSLSKRVVPLFARKKAFEEAGIILMISANQAFNNDLLIEAAELYESAANFLGKYGKKEIKGAVAANLARAAECYGACGKTRKAETLLIHAVMAALKVDEELLELDSRGWNAVNKGNFEEAAEIFKSVSSIFERGASELNIVIMSHKIGKLNVNSHAKLQHFTALYALLSGLFYSEIGDENSFIEALGKAQKIGQEALECMAIILGAGKANDDDENRALLDLFIHCIACYLTGVPWEANKMFDKISVLLNDKKNNKRLIMACEAVIDGHIPETIEMIPFLKLGKLDNLKNILIEILEKEEK
jgi:tetratricopeptide (TPR) repeat protein